MAYIILKAAPSRTWLGLGLRLGLGLGLGLGLRLGLAIRVRVRVQAVRHANLFEEEDEHVTLLEQRAPGQGQG